MSRGPVPPELDAITDRVLSFNPHAAVSSSSQSHPKSWGLSIGRVFEDMGLRFDAARFSPDLDSCVEGLRASGLPLRPLHDLADLSINASMPRRFERVHVDDERNGLPYLNATDLLSLFAVGRPVQQRFLSRQGDTRLQGLVIRQNWLLMTCSGTIGRVFHVPQRLDGWVATDDLIRICPKPGLVGYLFAWCMTPAAQVQVLAHTYGGQIDHVTDAQVGRMLVPMLPDLEARKLDEDVLSALEARERGLAQLGCIEARFALDG